MANRYHPYVAAAGANPVSSEPAPGSSHGRGTSQSERTPTVQRLPPQPHQLQLTLDQILTAVNANSVLLTQVKTEQENM